MGRSSWLAAFSSFVALNGQMNDVKNCALVSCSTRRRVNIAADGVILAVLHGTGKEFPVQLLQSRTAVWAALFEVWNLVLCSLADAVDDLLPWVCGLFFFVFLQWTTQT